MEKFLLVDGNSLLNRAFYALPCAQYRFGRIYKRCVRLFQYAFQHAGQAGAGVCRRGL